MNGPCLRWERITLHLRNPFRLSYGVSEQRDAFWIRLTDDAGWGEGTIPPYYRVDASAMMECWERAARQNLPFPEEFDEIPHWLPEGPAPARSALELALADRIGKRLRLPLYQLLNLPRPGALTTSFTIAIDTPDAMAKMASEIQNYSVIKLKLGSDDDESRVRAVREARPDAKLRVDANAGWSLDEAIAHLRWLERYNLELIEQPLAKDQHRGLGELQKRTQIPVVADESVQTMEDIEALASAGVRGINLKLMKVGGLTNGLRILKRSRELGMQVMLGCMIETSIGTTAMAHLAGLADWIDLDAPLLISNDPFDGIHYDEHATISLPDRPGIGVTRKGETP
jgi:L-alanine-DL-glutamate epimerase-like enolase superfamily enzyme